MDPISGIIGLMIVISLVKRVGEAIEASQGSDSPRAKARAARLAAAGITPAATGHPLRDYLANAWRDGWLDANDKRQAKRAARNADQAAKAAAAEESARARRRREMADRFDRATAGRLSRWRDENNQPPTAPSGRANGPGRTPPAADRNTSRPVDDEPRQRRYQATAGPAHRPADQEPYDAAPPLVSVLPGQRTEDPRYDSGPTGPGPGGEPHGDRSPILVGATVGQPIRDYPTSDQPAARRIAGPDMASPTPLPQAPTATPPAVVNGSDYRNPVAATAPTALTSDTTTSATTVTSPTTATPIQGEVMSAITGTAVTGVISGAGEARAIARAVEEANSAYVAALAQVRARINSLGDQTLAIVQMATRSSVVGALVQAGEAASQAMAAARSCGAEVAPLMGQVAREFDRRNS